MMYSDVYTTVAGVIHHISFQEFVDIVNKDNILDLDVIKTSLFEQLSPEKVSNKLNLGTIVEEYAVKSLENFGVPSYLVDFGNGLYGLFDTRSFSYVHKWHSINVKTKFIAEKNSKETWEYVKRRSQYDEIVCADPVTNFIFQLTDMEIPVVIEPTIQERLADATTKRNGYRAQWLDTLTSTYVEQGAHGTNEIHYEYERLANEVTQLRNKLGLNTIVLRRAAVVTTSATYTTFKNNTLYRVSVSHPYSIANKDNIDKILKETFDKEFGYAPESIIFDEADPTIAKYVKHDNSERTLKTVELTGELKYTTPSIDEALNAIKAKQLIHQYNRYVGNSPRLNKFYQFVLSIIGNGSIVSEMMDGPSPKYVCYFRKFLRTITGGVDGLTWRLNKFVDKLFPEDARAYVRDYYVTKFLAVQAKEEDVNVASALIAHDLQKLNSLNLLKGSLAPTGLIALADVIGDGQPRYIVYSYVLVRGQDQNVFDKLCDYSVEEGAQESKSISKPEKYTIKDLIPDTALNVPRQA